MTTVVRFAGGSEKTFENAADQLQLDGKMGILHVVNHDGEIIAVLFPHSLQAIYYPDRDRSVKLATAFPPLKAA